MVTHDLIKKLLNNYEQVLSNYKAQVAGKFSSPDLFEYNEILFSAHSCAIEGNSFSVDDTRALKELGLKLKLYNKTLLETYEILDHFNAYEFLFKNLHLNLSEDLLIQVHKILTKNTIEYLKGYKPGEYNRTQMAADDTIFPDHEISIENVPHLMIQTQKALNEGKSHPLEISARFHKYFIYLHPFPDGNGRIARLFSNFILAKADHPIVIITNDQKKAYIDALKQSHKHQDLDIISAFFITTAISRMEQEMEQLLTPIVPSEKQKTGPASKNKGLSFIF